MKNNTDKEKWISEVLNSTQGMHRASPTAGLFERLALSNGQSKTVRVVPFPAKQWAAAAVILLAINVGSVIYYNQHKAAAHNNPNPFATAMQTETTYDY